MRKHTIVALSFTAALLVACDVDTTPQIAGLAGPGAIAGISDSSRLVISPSSAQIPLGTSLQLSINVPAAASSQVEWASLNPTVATVTQDGLVTGGGLGSATIRARLVGDTTNVATSVIVVTAR